MCGKKTEQKFRTDDQVRVRNTSGVYERRGHVGTVISSYEPGEVDVKFPDSQIRYTFRKSELDLVPKFEEGDHVLVTNGARTGHRAVVTEIRERGALRLRFEDNVVLLYGRTEVEPAPDLIAPMAPAPPSTRPTVHEVRRQLRELREQHKKPVTLVGITGRKRAGKDTVAARLVEKYGFRRMAFADNVRKVALAIDPYVAPADIGGRFVANLRLSSIVDSVGWEAAKDFPEVRRILQKIGTEGIRSLEPDFWIRQVMRRAVFSSAPVVITDVRFPNEADAIKKAGGVILRVRRPGQDKDDQHSSESAMDGYLHDWSLNNSGTVVELHRQVDELVASGFKPA